MVNMETALSLPAEDLRERAERLRLVLTDSDGVLTDGGVYYSESGEALRRFTVRDGMGVERLREAGIGTAIVTRELSGCVERRSAKLRLPHLFLGVRDKAAHLPAILAETGLGIETLAYIGDDVNDLGIMAAIGERGLTAAPADAMGEVLAACHYRCTVRGGQGAFRDFAEWILALRRRSAEDRATEAVGAALPAPGGPGLGRPDAPPGSLENSSGGAVPPLVPPPVPSRTRQEKPEP